MKSFPQSFQDLINTFCQWCILCFFSRLFPVAVALATSKELPFIMPQSDPGSDWVRFVATDKRPSVCTDIEQGQKLNKLSIAGIAELG